MGGGHVGAEDGVHAGLVAGALGAEPGDDVGIEAQGEELLGRGDEDGILVPVGGDVLPIGVGGDGGFEFGFRQQRTERRTRLVRNGNGIW